MVKSNKSIEDMTPEELKTFRNSLDCDDMGFEDVDVYERGCR